MTTAPIVLAAGGTGGHVFPAEALARELLVRGQRPVLVTDKRGGAYGGALAEIETRYVRAGAIAGQGSLGKLRSFASLSLGAIDAYFTLGRIKPAVVVGFGGYPSVPTMIIAARRGIPTVIHEQNAVLGRANRFLAPRVDRIATSLGAAVEGTERLADKIVHTGMPARPAVVAKRGAPYAAPDAAGPVRILVLGGSQGAHAFAEIIPQAVAALPAGLRARLQVSQHCRAEDLDDVAETYRKLGVAADTSAFFADVPERLVATHLLIARAGASTIVELMTVGRPAILVPYPFAADDHQSANARAVEALGAGWMMPQDTLSPAGLAERLAGLFANPAELVRAAAAAAAAARTDAAARLADVVMATAAARESARNTSGERVGS